MPGKECRRCNVFKAATEFYRNKTNPDGLYNNCKACFAADAWSRWGCPTSAAITVPVMSRVANRSLVSLFVLGVLILHIGKECLEKPGIDRD